MERLNRIHKKFLKMILSLPETVADPAVYVLSGTAPIECAIHKRALTLYGNNCRLSEDTVEKQLARRQHSVKGYRGSSWFVEIRKLLLKYGLPPPTSMGIIGRPPYKIQVKAVVIKTCQHLLVGADQEPCSDVFQSEIPLRRPLLPGEEAPMHTSSIWDERCSTSQC